jgi:CRP-like cAMP-binding protein
VAIISLPESLASANGVAPEGGCMPAGAALSGISRLPAKTAFGRQFLTELRIDICRDIDTLYRHRGSRAVDKRDARAVMEQHGWLSRRPLHFREDVIKRSRLKRFAAGESLYMAGDGPAGMFGLISGQMRVRVPPADTIISIIKPGQWVGDATCFMRQTRWVSVTAGSPLHVLHLSQADFDEMIGDAENCRHFAINTAESLAEAITVVANLTQPDSEVRVAQRLLTFMGVHAEARFQALAVSQADLATMCGLSRQTLSKVLAGLVARGIIALHYRRIEIIDPAALRNLAIHDERVWR